MNNKTSKVFMAFAGGKESTEGAVVKRYIGIAPVFVITVNPTKAELEKIYNTTLEKDVNYLNEIEVNGKKVPQVRIDFIVKTDPVKSNGIETVTKATYFLNKEFQYNKDFTKVKVINKYGETTWLLIEDAKNKVIPENLSWFEAADFRPCYIGEEELTTFIKAYLNIPSKSYKDKAGKIIELPNKADAEARLDKVADYFKGDFRELKTVIVLQPNNKVKLAFGIKSTDDNKMYQAVFTHKPLKNNVTDYSKLDAEIKERQSNGGYSNTVFSVDTFKEFSIEATDFTKTSNTDDLPFSESEIPNPWTPKF